MALGVLDWAPDMFWRAVPAELMDALAGYREKHGIEDNAGPMTVAEALELFEQYG